MTNPESETANKTEYFKARIHNAAASGGAGIIVFAVVIAAQLIVGVLGVTLDHLYGTHHARHGDSLATEPLKR
jgi:hypothetical protein